MMRTVNRLHSFHWNWKKKSLRQQNDRQTNAGTKMELRLRLKRVVKCLGSGFDFNLLASRFAFHFRRKTRKAFTKGTNASLRLFLFLSISFLFICDMSRCVNRSARFKASANYLCSFSPLSRFFPSRFSGQSLHVRSRFTVARNFACSDISIFFCFPSRNFIHSENINKSANNELSGELFDFLSRPPSSGWRREESLNWLRSVGGRIFCWHSVTQLIELLIVRGLRRVLEGDSDRLKCDRARRAHQIFSRPFDLKEQSKSKQN